MADGRDEERFASYPPPHAEVRAGVEPRSTRERGPSFETLRSGSPQDEEGGCLACSPPTDEIIAAIRRFGRFYTRQLGALQDGLLQSRFSLAEARVLYELAQDSALTAGRIAGDLGLDPGYLSRILGRFEAEGILARSPSSKDARQSLLSLTEAGRAAFAPLDQASRDQVGGWIAPLTEDQRAGLVAALGQVEHLLGGAAGEIVLREHQPGDLGWMVSRHGALYASEYGWDGRFEGLVAGIVAEFVRAYDPAGERCWIAERDGARLGSVCLVRSGDGIAKLRLLLVEPEARGLGLGRRLTQQCLDFARAKGYRQITLWTNSNLVAARAIYERLGFRLTASEPHAMFGPELIGETWLLDL